MSTNGYRTIPPMPLDRSRQVIGRSRRVQHVSAKNDVNAIDGPEDDPRSRRCGKIISVRKSLESTLSYGQGDLTCLRRLVQDEQSRTLSSQQLTSEHARLYVPQLSYRHCRWRHRRPLERHCSSRAWSRDRRARSEPNEQGSRGCHLVSQNQTKGDIS